MEYVLVILFTGIINGNTIVTSSTEVYTSEIACISAAELVSKDSQLFGECFLLPVKERSIK